MLDIKGLEVVERLQKATYRVGETSAAFEAAREEAQRANRAYQEAMDRYHAALDAWNRAVEERGTVALVANVLLGTPI